MKNFKKLMVLAFALVVAATMGVSTTAEAAARFTGVAVTNTATAYANDTVITLAKSKKTVVKGVSKPSVTPVFKSSNTRVATVSSKGVVTAKGVGTAKIYVVFAKKGYTKVTKTITVKVVADRVTHIYLKDKTVITGMASVVKPVITASGKTANFALKWTASNPKILKVDAKTGKFRALAEGKTYLYAKSTDGTGVIGKCVVTVKKPITFAGLAAGQKKLYVGEAGSFTTKVNAGAFDSKANLVVSKASEVSATVKRVGTNKYTVTPNEKGTLVLKVVSNSKNPNGKYKYSKEIRITVVDKNVVKVEPKAGTTATATVTGTPKAIATDLEKALKATGAKSNNITVIIDGEEYKVVYDGNKVTVGGVWLGDVDTKTGRVSVKITDNFASYVEDMDVFAAFLGDKDYNFDITVGKNKFTSVKSYKGIYVVATVNGKEYKMYNVEKTLYIVGTKASLGDLATDLEKVATLTDVPQ